MTDVEGRRGHVLVSRREQHIRREGDIEHHDQSDPAGAGRPHLLCWLGPEGLREAGETCSGARRARKGAVDSAAVSEQAIVQGVGVRVGRQAQQAIREARTQGVNPGYLVGRTTPAWTRSSSPSLSGALSTTSTAWRRAGGMKLVFEKSRLAVAPAEFRGRA